MKYIVKINTRVLPLRMHMCMYVKIYTAVYVHIKDRLKDESLYLYDKFPSKLRCETRTTWTKCCRTDYEDDPKKGGGCSLTPYPPFFLDLTRRSSSLIHEMIPVSKVIIEASNSVGD